MTVPSSTLHFFLPLFKPFLPPFLPATSPSFSPRSPSFVRGFLWWQCPTRLHSMTSLLLCTCVIGCVPCVNLSVMKHSHSALGKKNSIVKKKKKRWLRWPQQHVQLSAVSCESQTGSAAHLDVLYARVPLVHLLHSDEQDVVQLVHAGLQDRLQPEDLPGPRQHFATDHVPVALSGHTTNDVYDHYGHIGRS